MSSYAIEKRRYGCRETDLDDTGIWANSAIRERYWQNCSEMNLESASAEVLYPTDTYTLERGWIVSLMHALIDRIRQGDLAAADIGIELMEEDGGFVMGRMMKTKCARSLRLCALTEPQKDRVRRRVVDMLERGFCPGEFRSYARLARRNWNSSNDAMVKRIDTSQPWLAWYVRYLTQEDPGPHPPSRKGHTAQKSPG